MSNKYNEIMLNYTDIKLINIITHLRKDYQPEAIEAAEAEIKKRNLSESKIKELQNELEQTEKDNATKKEVQKQKIKKFWNYLKIPSGLSVNIKIAASLIYLSIILDIIRTILIYKQGLAVPHIKNILNITTIIYLFTVYMIHTGKNWARLIFISMVLSFILLIPVFLMNSYEKSTTLGIYMSVATIIRLLAIYFLFNKNSLVWYNQNFNTYKTEKFWKFTNNKLIIILYSVLFTLIFGFRMFTPIVKEFDELKIYGDFYTWSVLIGNSIILILIFFIWHKYLSKSISPTKTV